MRKYRNGKRTFQITPALIVAGTVGNHGYATANELESLVAIQWICKRLLAWTTKRNIYDMLYKGGGINHREWPVLITSNERELSDHYQPYTLLHYLMAKLANPGGWPEWNKFARRFLGYKALHKPLTVRARKPSGSVPHWLGCLYGVRLKVSPNECHKQAYWLHGGAFHLSSDAKVWTFSVGYSYRDESSSWSIGIDQKRGEKFEVFLDRIWTWLEPQIKWRHSEGFYAGFCIGVDGMKQNELRTCSEAEFRMYQMRNDIKSVFSWGRVSPDYDEQIALRLLVDAHDQYRNVEHIDMTENRLELILRWIAADRRNAARTKNKDEALRNR